MNEIIDVISFLTKEGVCKDMQREIMSYYSSCGFIDVLTINGFYNGVYKELCKEFILHVPNRDDFKPIIRCIFETLEDHFYISDKCTIKRDEIIFDDKSYSIEKLAKALKIFEYLGTNNFPFDVLMHYDSIQVTFERERLKYL